MPFYKYIFITIMTFSINTRAWEEGFAYNGDIKIAYRDYGPSTGDPILLVQGLGGQLINWPDHLLDFLIDNGYRPIVFDNRDFVSCIGSHKWRKDVPQYGKAEGDIHEEYSIDLARIDESKSGKELLSYF